MASTGRVMRGARWVEPLREALAVAPADPAAWMAQHTRVIKSDTYSRVGLLELQQQPCFLKLYLAKSALQSLAFRLGFGRPFRSFDAAMQMRDAGLPVPLPRACLSVTAGVFLLTEAIPASQDLSALWQSYPTSTQAAQLLHCAGETLAALHRAGFAHGDCKWSNLLWGGEQFYLVDLEGVRMVGLPKPASQAAHSKTHCSYQQSAPKQVHHQSQQSG